jgi:hypothetical protein
MAQVQQHLLRLVMAAVLAPSVYSADAISPAEREAAIRKIQPQKIPEFPDFLAHSCGSPGERHTKDKTYPSMGIDRNGEVPDSSWYQNRHGRRRMTLAELVRGPGNSTPPSPEGKWKIISGKTEGVTPGFLIEDSRGRKYLLKFDPPKFPEMASGADVVTSKFFHALGYHVPENYIAYFERSRLVVDPKQKGKKPITEKDVDKALAAQPQDSRGRYRALASRLLEGELVGPFRFHGTREDDPDDTIPHEHRRELRGLYVFSAWLNHTDAKSGNTLDTVVRENGMWFVKHHLIDFGASMGSASHEAKSPRQGHEYHIDVKPSLLQIATFGFVVPKWARVKQSDSPAVGAFEAEAFEPDNWKPNYPNPAFENRLPGDTLWAARKVAAFRDADIRAMVETGQYSDPRAADWIVKALIGRRDKIVRAFAEGSAAAAGMKPAAVAERR